MDPEAAKAAARAERLKQLQMEDLGSARREYISTTDIKRTKNVSMQALEAVRMSNVRGSDEQRTAEANKEKLTGWANVYKEIGDTEDLENLDRLLDGQTHRHHLNSFIRESGGQTYARESGKGKATSKAVPKDPPYAKNSPGLGAPKHHQRAVAMGNHAVMDPKDILPKQPPLARKTSMNISRGLPSSYQKKRETNDQKPLANKGGFKKPPPASLRTRRPTPDYVGEISSPESFLAAARKVLNPNPSQNTPVPDGSVSRDPNGDSHLSPGQLLQKKAYTSLNQSIHCPPGDTRSHSKPLSEPAKKPVPPGTTTSLDHSIHKDHGKKASVSQDKPTIPLDDSIHRAKGNDGAHSKQAPEPVNKHPAKQVAPSLGRSIHSPQNRGAFVSKELSKSRNQSTVSLVRSNGNTKDEKASRPKALPEPATEPSPKRPLTSLERSIHAPKDDGIRPEAKLSLTLKRLIAKASPKAPTSLQRSYHAPQNDDTRPEAKLSPSSDRSIHELRDDDTHPKVRLPPSLDRSIHGPQDNTIHSKASPDSTAKSSPKRLPTPLDRSIHGPRHDDTLPKRITEPVINPELKATPKLSKAVQPSFPTEEPEVRSRGPSKLQLDTFIANNNTQGEHGLLLDFDTTPTKGPSQSGSLNDPMMSPGCEDLKGLSFALPCPSQQVQTLKQEQLQSTPRRKLDFGPALTELKESQPDPNDLPSTPGKSDAVLDSPTEMEMLCRLLASTSLSNKRKVLQECKEELESKQLFNAQKTPRLACLETEQYQPANTPTSQTPIGSPTSVLSPQSQLNVAARSFVPRASFQHHRSPTRSLSSDSTQHAPSVEDKVAEKKQPAVPAARHIIGSHLLPGRRGRSDESGNTFASTRAPPKPAANDSIIFRPRRTSKPVRITDPNGNPLNQSIYASSSPAPCSSQ